MRGSSRIQFTWNDLSASAALFIAACLAHDWRKHRVVHPAYVIGGLVIVASWPLRNMIGHSDWYFPIGESVARLARANWG